jgi:Protein of unknown function DUF115
MNLTFGAFNDKITSEKDRQYAKNSAENYLRIKADFEKADYSIDTLPRFNRDVPGLILGSGPTLDEAMPYLHEFKGIIFASPSQLDILEKWEIKPTYVVAVDSTDQVADEQIRSDRDTYGMTLLTHPYVSPRVLDVWKGRKRYFQLIANDPHFSDVYPWITMGWPIAGSVNNVEAMIADWMGLSPIILCGVDYCCPRGQARAQDYKKLGPYSFEPKPLRFVEADTSEPVPEGLTPTISSQEMLFYANLLLGIWKMTKMPLIQVGNQGACSEIPNIIGPQDLGKKITVPETTDETWAEVDRNMTSFGMYADVVDGIGKFHYREQELAAIGPAREALQEAMRRADFWSKVKSSI